MAGLSANIADGASVALELLLLPIYQRGTTDGRMIGVLAPVSIPYWLGTHPVQSLTLNTWRHVSTELELTLVPKFFELPPEAADPVAPAGVTAPARTFVVFNGGRA